GPEASDSVAQLIIADFRKLHRDPRGFLRIAQQWGLALEAAERGLPQPDAPDRLPAEEAVDALQNHARKMLDLKCSRTFDAQNQRARLRPLAWSPPRPLYFFRLRGLGNFCADNLIPAGD